MWDASDLKDACFPVKLPNDQTAVSHLWCMKMTPDKEKNCCKDMPTGEPDFHILTAKNQFSAFLHITM